MTRAWLALALVLLAPPLDGSGAASAQLARRLGDPSAAEAPRADRSPRAIAGLGHALGDPSGLPPAPPEEPGEPERPWPGPQIQLGYSFYRVSDGYGGGDVHAGSVGVFIQLPLPELRVGLLGEVGARDYSLGGDDLIVRGGIEVGVQLLGLLDPFVPHAVVLASFGGVVAERFETTVADAFGGAGLGIGGELRAYRNLHLGFQVSYQRLEMDGAGYDVFMIRLFAGF